MNPTPLIRACLAVRLPKGLFTDQGGLYLKDSQIRSILRNHPTAVECLIVALADLIDQLRIAESEDVSDVWYYADVVVLRRDLPPSMVGVLAGLAMLPEEGSVDPAEWALMVNGCPELSRKQS